MLNEACLVCSHVVESVDNTQFICRDSSGWVAACRANCEDFDSAEKLSMMHVGHLLQREGICREHLTLPKNFMIKMEGTEPCVNYLFDDELYDPEEGDFIAPQAGDPLFDIADDDEVFVYRLENDVIVSVTLDEGTVVLPFFLTTRSVQNFERYLGEKERLSTISFLDLKKAAAKMGFVFLGPDFLKQKFDKALSSW